MAYSQSFIDEHRDINTHHDWWDSVYDDFNQICTILGVALNEREPCFSGFWSQGDGASWTGRYWPYRGETAVYDTAPDEIRNYAGDDEELYRIADELCLLARVYWPVCAKVSRSGRYSHEHTMQIADWSFWVDDDSHEMPSEILDHIETTLLELFQDLARWLYKTLEAEYDHLTSDEAVAETLEANEIEEDDEDADEAA